MDGWMIFVINNIKLNTCDKLANVIQIFLVLSGQLKPVKASSQNRKDIIRSVAKISARDLFSPGSCEIVSSNSIVFQYILEKYLN